MTNYEKSPTIAYNSYSGKRFCITLKLISLSKGLAKTRDIELQALLEAHIIRHKIRACARTHAALCLHAAYNRTLAFSRIQLSPVNRERSARVHYSTSSILRIGMYSRHTHPGITVISCPFDYLLRYITLHPRRVSLFLHNPRPPHCDVICVSSDNCDADALLQQVPFRQARGTYIFIIRNFGASLYRKPRLFCAA